MKYTIPSLRISTVEDCNFRCNFCQIDGDFSSDYGLEKPKDWISLIGQSAQRFFNLGVRHFSVTGGEPLLNPHTTFGISRMLRKWLADAAATDSYLRLNTNGVLVGKYADQIASLYDLVKISLHSLQSDSYGKITGSPSPERDLKRTLQGIERLSQRGVKMRLQMCVTRKNKEEIWDFIRFCQNHPSIRDIKIFDITEYSKLWRHDLSESESWDKNFVSLKDFEQKLKKQARLLGVVQSVGGYGNPMNVYQLGNLRIRLRRSDVGAYYGLNCEKSCTAFITCVDGHCNLEIGPNCVIKVCRPKEGIVFALGEEKKAIDYFQTTSFNPRIDVQTRLRKYADCSHQRRI
ncbi:MAG: radical SAM protein [Verrucomicrobiota bacterium]